MGCGLWCIAFLVLLGNTLSEQVYPDPEVAIREPKNAQELAMVAWMKGAGARVGAVDMANFTNPLFPNYKLRGLRATADLKPQDQLFAITREALFSTETARNSSVGEVYTQYAKVLPDELLLSVHLLWEFFQPASKWGPYFNALPRKFFTACEFESSEVDLLQGSPLMEETKARQRMFEVEYQTLFPLLSTEFPQFFSPAAQFSFAAFKYARLVVQTRAFRLTINEETSLLALVPFADMLNHSPTAEARWEYDSGAHVFKLFTMQSYDKDRQVYINYGQRSNRRLLLDFGFVLEANPYDFVDFPGPQILPNDHTRLDILSTIQKPYQRRYMAQLGTIPSDLLAAVRVALATPEELEEMQKHLQLHIHEFKTGKRGFNTSLSIPNEGRTLSWVAHTSVLELEKYPQSYEADTATLTNIASPLGRNAFHAVFIRHAEKRVYVYINNFAHSHLPLLEVMDRYSRRLGAMALARYAMSEADYVNSVVLGQIAKSMADVEAARAKEGVADS